VVIEFVYYSPYKYVRFHLETTLELPNNDHAEIMCKKTTTTTTTVKLI